MKIEYHKQMDGSSERQVCVEYKSKKLNKKFLTEVAQKFSPDFFSQAEETLKIYGGDWTRVFNPEPSAVVFPRKSEEVARFLSLCSQYSVAVVPSGGRTGLAGGAVAAQGEVVLSLSRMNRMGPVDILAQTVRVEAGAVTEAVHQHCLPYGLTWPVDFASKGSSQVGGNISTNAGGVKVIRYGLTRNWVLGLQVVIPTGETLELNGALEKNNTGVDLRQIFIGSEGILGVITEATLKLTRIPGELDVFFFALKDVAAVFELFCAVRQAPFQVMAFEFLTRNCLEAVTSSRGLKSPFENSTHFESEAYVLLEIERPETPRAQEILDQWLEDRFSSQQILDGTLAQSPRERRDLWSLREGVSESLSMKGLIHKNDIALPISCLKEFISSLYELFSKRHSVLEIYVFGHIGDGNLHINTLKSDTMDKGEFLKRCHEADHHLFELVKKYGGSISAEHGIGLLKKNDLLYSRSPVEIEIMKKMKKIFDPQNLLNPGKIF